MNFSAHYFPPHSARKLQVRVFIDADNRLHILDEDDAEIGLYEHSQMRIMPALAGTRRSIRFSTGAMIETTDEEAIAQIEAYAPSSAQRIINRMERNMKIAYGAVAAIALIFIAFFIWGLPWIAQDVAKRFPKDIRDQLSVQAIEHLENAYMWDTSLSAYAQKDIRDLAALVEERTGIDIKLRIRSFKAGPNALALPDGTVYITDEIYELAENNDQILAVLFHEAAHIEEQHAIQLLVRQAGILFMMSFILGDVSGLPELGTGLPNFLLQNSYSREFETEADLYATEHMLDMGKDAEPMKRLLYLLESEGGAIPFQDFILTHPSASKRIESIDLFVEEYHQRH